MKPSRRGVRDEFKRIKSHDINFKLLLMSMMIVINNIKNVFEKGC